ncbi:MAG: hypothetical protein ACTH3B_06170, partial [Pseudoalteromonas sp.]
IYVIKYGLNRCGCSDAYVISDTILASPDEYFDECDVVMPFLVKLADTDTPLNQKLQPLMELLKLITK